ncbi:MAG: 2-oxoacid:acceptor oxidoreductase subunit alpha [Candidatus Lindowbacteria bacterium]|nr:2-oxoacid:acceptor oxidoreductase subunit alpha [Candidatus Lindowbacteria bacterium]
MANDGDLTIGIAGSGGDGVIVAGDFLAWAAASEGLYCFMVKSLGSQIRGGESSCKVRISENPVLSQGDKLDVLVVFNWADYAKFKSELEITKGAVVLYDSKDSTPLNDIPLSRSEAPIMYRVPFHEIAAAQVGRGPGKNMVMLGVLAEMFGLAVEAIRDALKKKFERKGHGVVELNLRAFDAGRRYVREEIHRTDAMRFSYTKREPKMVISGNEALALGAMAARVGFFSGYPITPASEIMEYLARLMPLHDGVWVQAEDEIAALGMALGASFAGRRAMTATSGPGLSLMNEMIGLASLAELPVVIVDVQRVGPSTGMPTKTEQSDLQQALYGTHGDAPRAVIAPADVEDCFHVAMEAFCIAEEYQLPVIILSDQFIGQRKESVPRFDRERIKVCDRLFPEPEELENYRRYAFTDDGISSMSFPGMKIGEYTAAGIEHDEYGNPSSSPEMHEKMNAKRFRKLETLRCEWKFVRRYGPPDAEVGVIGWGSTKGAIKEAVLRADAEGLKVAGLVPQLIYPLPYEDLDSFLQPLKKVIVVEMSYSAQFLKYLRANFRLPDDVALLKRSGGRPFSVEEIYEKIEQEVSSHVHV